MVSFEEPLEMLGSALLALGLLVGAAMRSRPAAALGEPASAPSERAA
jgi:hypothetical protein